MADEDESTHSTTSAVSPAPSPAQEPPTSNYHSAYLFTAFYQCFIISIIIIVIFIFAKLTEWMAAEVMFSSDLCLSGRVRVCAQQFEALRLNRATSAHSY